jgi:predicted dehydrogenase
VALDVIGRNRALTDLRFEKPCCASEDELADVVAAADRAGVQVSCGYTLLAHPAYVWVSKMGGRCTVLHAWRSSSAPARHDVSAMLDLGSHAAGLAAWLGGSPEIVAAHDAGVDVRWTTIRTENVGVVEVDEGAGVVFFRGEPVAFGEHDALRDELRAFLLGAPIADAGTGLAAHRIIAGQAVAA